MNAKKCLLYSTTSFVATVAACVLASQNAIAQVKGGIFLRNVNTINCIDVPGDPGIANNSRLALFDCEIFGTSVNGRTTDQKWEYISAGFIRNVLSNKCIDVVGGPGTANGASVQLFDCELSGFSVNGRTTDQIWEYTSTGFIRNELSGKCIDVSGDPGTANGAPLQLFDCEFSGVSVNGRATDQRWAWMPRF